MAPRDRVAFLAITALVLVPAVLVGVVIPNDGCPMSTSFRLGDVGDRWRALLFGAPPSFL